MRRKSDEDAVPLSEGSPSAIGLFDYISKMNAFQQEEREKQHNRYAEMASLAARMSQHLKDTLYNKMTPNSYKAIQNVLQEYEDFTKKN